MNSDPKLNFNARADRSLIGAQGGDRHIVIDVEAPRIERDERSAPPLSLALVIDASGSMSGERIEMAKRAAAEVAASLNENDRLSVVSFASEVLTHVDGLPMDAAGRDRARAEIGKLGPRGCTDLAAGWATGAGLAEKHAGKGFQKRVILLSDGHANRGETDPEILGLKAAEMRKRGVYTSAVGIGDNYSPIQLNVIAENGGGQIHRAARPGQIDEIVTGELGQIREIAADDVKIRLRFRKGVKIEVLGPFPVLSEDESAEISLGSLISGASRRVVVKAGLPLGAEGETEEIRIEPGWIPAGAQDLVAGEPIMIGLHRVPVIELAAETPDADVVVAVATAWRDALVLRATAMIEDGAQDEAGEMIQKIIPEFSDYCRDVPGTAKLVQGLKRFRTRLRSPFDNYLLCEASVASSKGIKFCTELRQDFQLMDVQRELGLEE